MRERPILFSAPMVRAILAGQKTQTRRVVMPQPQHPQFGSRRMLALDDEGIDLYLHGGPLLPRAIRCPYGKPGDRLWVRETWNQFEGWKGYFYAADAHLFGIGEFDDPDHIPEDELRWKPSIHMPRAASRITLEVTGVRVDRLQDISRGDAMAEGCPFPNMADGDDPRQWFADLWSQINGPEAWQANPWVWVVEFKRLEAAC